jgi:hypothetical protein
MEGFIAVITSQVKNIDVVVARKVLRSVPLLEGRKLLFRLILEAYFGLGASGAGST